MTRSRCWVNLHAATMDPQQRGCYGAIRDAALVTSGENIAWIGPRGELPSIDAEVTDCGGRWLTPGLIDCHTHLVYGGHRADEFEMRLQGISYAEIAQRGGGILSTVRATRQASEESLFVAASRRLQALLAEGVTGIEIKSGYGLDRETELRMLRVARRLGERYGVDITATYLGAHAMPPEASSKDAYIDWICSEMLPHIAAKRLADAVDVFCENIGFSLAQTRRLFDAATALGLPVKAHAEQLTNLGGTALAAHYGAQSADHLEYLDGAGIAAIADSGTVAVLLPGAFYFLRETRLPPVAELFAAGVPVAIATDSNPGSAPVHSLLLMLNMACTLFRMTPEQALAGVTRNAARALNWQTRRGVLRAGMQADLVFWNIDAPAELAYGIGHNPCARVIHRGRSLGEDWV